MPLTSLTKDPATLTLTVVGDYHVPQQRLWDAFADPRQLERFWGPPDFPATFTRHDFVVGGRAEYFLALPEGQQWHGAWQFTAIDAIDSFSASDGDSNADDTNMPAAMSFAFATSPLGARLTIVTQFSSIEAMEQTVPGMEQGLRAAMPQLDAVLAESIAQVTVEADGRRSVQSEIAVPGTREEVWQAIATGPGLSSWFVPAVFEEADGQPVAVQFTFGPDMAPRSPIIEWDPPRMFAAQGEGWDGSPPMTMVWHFDAHADGTCAVRIVNSLVADSAAWDPLLLASAATWPGFFRTLHIYMTYFRGQPSALLQFVAPVPGTEAEAWDTVTGALGLHGADIGQHWTAPAQVPALSGVIAYRSEDPYDLLVRCDQPGPGVAALGAFGFGEQSMVALNLYHYGENAAATAAAAEPLWQAWMQRL